MSFSDLGLMPELMRAVADAGYDPPSPIQRRRFRWCLRAAICWLAPRPAPARPPPSCCRSCSGSTPHEPTARAARARARSSRRRANWPRRSRKRRDYGKIPAAARPSVYGGVGIDPQINALRGGCRYPRCDTRAGCSTSAAACGRPAGSRGAGARRSRPHARHGLHPATSSRIIAACRTSARTCCFPRLLPTTSARSRESMLRDPASIQVTPRNPSVEMVEQRVHPRARRRKARTCWCT